MIRQFFDDLFKGKKSKEEIKAVLKEMHERGETVWEITEAARSMRENMVQVSLGYDTLDIVGTGGDNKSTLNISTMAAFVAAGAGCKVFKHFNKGVTSKFGSGELLERLGVDINMAPKEAKKLINKEGIAFAYAPNYHPATRYVKDLRQELDHRTIFNLLGPLTNPANAKRALIGAYSVEAAEKIAMAAHRLDFERAVVVYSTDGFDEISIGEPTIAFESDHLIGEPIKYQIEPVLRKVKPDCLRVESAEESEEMCRKILYRMGKGSRDEREYMMETAVVVNAGYAIYINRGADTPKEGYAMAKESLRGGAAAEKLEAIIRFQNKNKK